MRSRVVTWETIRPLAEAEGLAGPVSVTDDELGGVLASANADLVFVGHTHVPLDRTAAGVRVVNLGSVSNPVTADLRASYVLLDADERGYHIERRRVEYDRAASLAALEASGNPSTPFISEVLRGKRRSPWAQHDDAGTGVDGQ
jgi:diadenosine tetraphosphatase ApaH/serine/threonine PP2A family protein phosphatase